MTHFSPIINYSQTPSFEGFSDSNISGGHNTQGKHVTIIHNYGGQQGLLA